jgi:hypothetical protein
MNAEEFLKLINIELKSTTLVVHIDGHNRQPNLCDIMEMYANHKIKLIIETLSTIGIHIPSNVSVTQNFRDTDIQHEI